MYRAYPVPRSLPGSRGRLLTRTALSGALLAAAPAGAVVPIIQQYYTSAGGTTPNGINAPAINTQTPGITSITVNDKRTLIDVGSTQGYGYGASTSTFNPTVGNEYDVHFGTSGSNRDWIAIFRSADQITIDGTLKALQPDGTVGGNIWLLGIGGVTFTTNANVMTGGLLATTSNLSSASLASFLTPSSTSVAFDVAPALNKTIQLSSGASINSNGSLVAFIAPTVTTSSGATITGLGGSSILYGAANTYTVSFAPSSSGLDLLNFEVSAGVDSSGYGLALGGATTTAGNIYASAVNQQNVLSAVINATGTMTATTASSSGGNIVLSAGSGIAARAPSTTTAPGGVNLSATNLHADGRVVAAATGNVTIATASSGGDATFKSGQAQDGNTAANGGNISISDLTVGDDLLVTAINGYVDMARVTLAGMGNDGVDVLVRTQTSGNVSQDNPDNFRIAIGRPPELSGQLGYGYLTGHSATDNVVIDSASTVHIEVTGNLHLTTVTSGSQGLIYDDPANPNISNPQTYGHEVFLRSTGDLSVGTATATIGSVLVNAGGNAVVGSASAAALPVPASHPAADSADKGAILIHGGASASLGTGAAPTDIYVVADNGNAVAGTLKAGDDIYVVANNGFAQLTSAEVDNSVNGYPGASDIDTNSVRGTSGVDANGNPTFTPFIPGFSEDNSATRVIKVAATANSSSLANVQLGVGGQGGVKFTGISPNDSSAAILSADNDVVVSSPYSLLRLDSVSSGNDATITTTAGSLSIGSLSAGRNAMLTATGGDVVSTDGIFASGDVGISALSGAVSLNNLNTDGTASITGRSISISDFRSIGSASLTATAGDIVLNPADDLRVGDMESQNAPTADFTAHASGGITVGDAGNGYGGLRATGGVSLTAGGAISTYDIEAGGGITLAGGSLSAGFLDAVDGIDGSFTGRVESTGLRVNGSQLSARGGAALSSSAMPGISLGTTTGDIVIANTVDTSGNLSLATAAGSISIGNQNYGSLSVDGAIDLHATGGNIDLSNLSPAVVGGDVTMTATGAVSIYDLETAGLINASAGGSLHATRLATTGASATSSITVSGSSVQVDTVQAAGDFNATATGNLAVGPSGYGYGYGQGSFSAGGSINLSANSFSALNLGTVGNLHITATGGAGFSNSLANTTATALSIQADGTITLPSATAGSIALTSLNGGIQSSGSLSATSGSLSATAANGTLSLGSLSAATNLTLSGRTLALQSAGGPLNGTASLTATAGDLTLGSGATLSAFAVSLTSTTGNIIAAAPVTARNGDVTATATNGNVQLGVVSASNNVTITGKSVSAQSLTGSLNGTAGLTATAGNVAITGGSAVSANRIALASTGGNITTSDLTARGNDLSATASGGAIQLGALSGSNNVTLTGRSVKTSGIGGALNGAVTMTSTAGELTIGGANPVSALSIALSATGGDLTAFGGLTARQGNLSAIATSGNLQLGALGSAGDLTLSGKTVSVASVGGTVGGAVSMQATAGNLALSNAAINASGNVALAASGDLNVGSVSSARQVSLIGGGAVNAQMLTTTGAADSSSVAVRGATVAVRTVQSAGDVIATAATSLSLGANGGSFAAGRDVTLSAASFTLPSLGTVRDLDITATGTGFTAPAAFSPTRDLRIRATGTLVVPGASAGGSIQLTGAAVTSTNTLSAGTDIVVNGGAGLVRVATLSAGRDILLTGGSLTSSGDAVAARDITATIGGAAGFNNMQAGDDVTLTATGALTTGGLTATGKGTDTEANGSNVFLTGATVTTSGTVSATGDIVVNGGTGALRLATLAAGRDLTLTGGSLVATGDYRATRDISATIGGAASFNNAQAGDDLTLTATGALTAANLTTTGGIDNASNGSNIALTGASVAAVNLASASDLSATAKTGALTLASSGGQVTAGRDMRLTGASVSTPSVSARDLSVTVTGGDYATPATLTSSRDMTITTSGKLTLASLMVGRDLTLSAAGGVVANQTLAPGRDATISSTSDVTVGTVRAGDDVRITTQGKVTADSLVAGGGSDSEPNGRNITVVAGSTAIASAVATDTVSITPAPPAAVATIPWAQAYYGGTGGAAPTSAVSPGLLDIYLNASRTITDWASTDGVSNFHPSTTQAVHFHFGSADWIAIVRSTGQIQVDGQLQTLIGNTSAVGGNLWLMSGAGVLFGANARVDVGGLVATSASFSSMADALDTSKTSFGFDVAGNGGVTIAAGAILNATGGALAFVGPTVSSAAGSQVDGRGGASVLYAATGTATLNYTPASGNLTFASANGDFSTGAVALAGTTTVDGSATLGGASVSVASLQTGGAATVLATNGGITAGTVTTGGNANFSATGKVSLDTLTATGDVTVVAADLDVGTRLAANSLVAQAIGGNMTVGGDGSGAGFAVSGAEMGRLKLTRGASFYAGLTGNGAQSAQATGSQRAQATVRGDMVVADMTYDPANLPELDLYAGTGHTVSVTGAVKPTTSGGIIQIGNSLASSDWRPSAINVSGTFGSAIIYNEKCFDQVVSVGDLRLFSSGDIVFGSTAFQQAVASTAAGSIDVARGTPSSSGGNNQLFAVTQRLTLGAPGKIVQQNTATTSGPAVGLLLANQDNASSMVLSVTGAPTALDLFGSLIDASGALRSSINAAAASELQISGTTKANYRFNGCALANAANCSILDTSAVSGAQKGSSIRKELDDQDGTGGN